MVGSLHKYFSQFVWELGGQALLSVSPLSPYLLPLTLTKGEVVLPVAAGSTMLVDGSGQSLDSSKFQVVVLSHFLSGAYRDLALFLLLWPEMHLKAMENSLYTASAVGYGPVSTFCSSG